MTVFPRIKDFGLIPVVTIDSVQDAKPVAEALIAGGLPCAEVTFRTDAAEAAIRLLVDTYPEMVVGAGTVTTTSQAQAAVASGAQFVVSPGFDDAVVDWCLGEGVTVVPGVMTPTEIATALRKGLSVLKFFPAEPAGGVNAIAAIGAVYPDVRFIPTGGINAGNLADYLRLPMVDACAGSWVTDRRVIEQGDFRRVTELTVAAVDIVRTTRTP